MRVLHIGKYYPPYHGGMERYLADLLPALRARGVECAALVHAHDSQSVTRGSDESGVHVIRAPSHGRLVYAPISPAFPYWLSCAIKDFHPQMLHMHMPNTSALWALVLPSARRLPWVVHWHSDVVASNLEKRLALAYPAYRPLEQAMLKRAKAIVATSPAYLEASEALALWRDKCQVVPLGLDTRRYPPSTRQARGWAADQWPREGTLKVLTVGRMSYYKGHEILMRAIARQPKTSLLVVGDGEKRPAIEALINQLGVGNRVSLAGCLPDEKVNALMESCDVFCLPSLERTEAFGMVLLEAMRYSRPAVASRIQGSGVGWVVKDKGTGLLCETGNTEDLAEKLGLLADDAGLRLTMGKAASRRFEEMFRIEAGAERISAIYAGL